MGGAFFHKVGSREDGTELPYEIFSFFLRIFPRVSSVAEDQWALLVASDVDVFVEFTPIEGRLDVGDRKAYLVAVESGARQAKNLGSDSAVPAGDDFLDVGIPLSV